VLWQIRDDVRFAKTLNDAGTGRAATSWPWLRLALRSRGLLMLATSRVGWACSSWSPEWRSGRLVNRAVRVAVLLGTRVAELLSKSQLAAGQVIEGGVYLSERGHIVVGARSIGAGTIIHDRVTIGRGVGSEDNPEIGRRVWIGPHCVVFGRIRLGDGATVLPHTVLSKSVPDGAVVQGNPARIARRDFDNSALRRTLARRCDTLAGEAMR
jgi:serine acetyltransferase